MWLKYSGRVISLTPFQHESQFRMHRFTVHLLLASFALSAADKPKDKFSDPLKPFVENFKGRGALPDGSKPLPPAETIKNFRLAEGLAKARGIKDPTAQDLGETYQMAMRVLFRLLFIAYGEDKDLLPYRFNGLYQKRSLKAKARELLNIEPDQFDESDWWWVEVQNLFKAVVRRRLFKSTQPPG